MKVFLYARKSTEDEERQIMSIEAQLFELAEFAKRENLDILERFIESKSAKKPGREIFNKMIAQVYESKEPVGLLAWHPDRLARNSVDGGQIIYLIDIGKIASLRFPTFWFEPTPQGKFMLQVAFGQSKYYSDNLAENIKRGIRQKLRRGEWSTLAPLGYVNDSRIRNIVPDPFKSVIIRQGFEEYAQGKHTLESLSERLKFLGLVNNKGKAIATSSIHEMLSNPVYTGIIKFKGETYEGKFEPIISRATFEAVQNMLKLKGKLRKCKRYHNFPYRGLLTCGECGCGITAQVAKGNGGVYRYYRCTKKKTKCSQSYIQEDTLTAQLKEQLQKVALPLDWTEKMREQVTIWSNEETQYDNLIAQNLKDRVRVIDDKLEILLNAYLDGVLDKELFLKKKEELITEKVRLRENQDFGRKKLYWLEPLRKWIMTASSVEEIVQSNDMEKICSLTDKIGTNRRLLSAAALVDFKRPYDLILKFKSFFAQSQTSLKSENSKITEFPVWWR